MIILGYPGIGKSTYANTHDFAIDLDYMNSNLLHYYVDTYSIAYMTLDTARMLSDQGYTVFVPWSQELQHIIIDFEDRLDRGFYIIYPTKGMLKEAKKFCKEVPDHISNQFLRDINAIHSAPDSIFIKVELTGMDYDLEKIIDGLEVMQEIWGELEGTGKHVSENRNKNI